MIRLFFISTLIAACFSSCKSKEGKILPPEKMKVVLWDIFMADAFTDQFVKKDSSKNEVAENEKMYRQIFSIHKISKADFETTYNYYKQRPPEMRTLMDSITALAERSRRDLMMKKYSKPPLKEKK